MCKINNQLSECRLRKTECFLTNGWLHENQSVVTIFLITLFKTLKKAIKFEDFKSKFIHMFNVLNPQKNPIPGKNNIFLEIN